MNHLHVTMEENTTTTPASAAPGAPLAAAAAPVVPFFRRNNKFKTSIRKRPATPPDLDNSDNSDDDDDDDDDAGSSDEKSKARRWIKRQKKTGLTDASTVTKGGGRGADDKIVPSGFGLKSKEIISTNDATKSTSYHNENEAEYLSRKNNKPTTTIEVDNSPNSGTYKGQSAYGTFIKRSENAPQRQTGPLKAPTNIRTITVTDFAPDVCKDYKQTGFCGFGDNCKFLHAREDYAQGWQLDKDWEIKKKNPNAKTNFKTLHNASAPVRSREQDQEDDVDKELKDIPFACVICKKEYKSPIVTKCGHYFCETCAINRYKRKNPSCAICGSRTDGVFNVAKGLQKKLDLKKKRLEEKEREEAENKRAEEEAGFVIQGGW